MSLSNFQDNSQSTYKGVTPTSLIAAEVNPTTSFAALQFQPNVYAQADLDGGCLVKTAIDTFTIRNIPQSGILDITIQYSVRNSTTALLSCHLTSIWLAHLMVFQLDKNLVRLSNVVRVAHLRHLIGM